MRWSARSVARSSGGDESDERPAPGRRFRVVPPAITPVYASDVIEGVAGHLGGRGLEGFRTAVRDLLHARVAGTYTSYRRALGACLLELAGVADGDRTLVLVPAFCSADIPDAVEGVGFDVRRYDVDDETLAPDIASLESRPVEDALAAVVVNPLGFGSPMDDVVELCAERDAFVVETLGYALGTEYRGRRLGSFGDCAVLNFQQGKPIPVGGGMVVSRRPDVEFGDAGRPPVAPNVLALSGYAAFSRPRPYYLFKRLSGLLDARGAGTGRPTTHPESKDSVRYRRPFATMSDFQGAVGSRVLGRLDADRRARARTARFYDDAFEDCPGVRRFRSIDGLAKNQYVRYPLLVESTEHRDAARRRLLAAGIHATTLYDWPPIDAGRFPGAASVQRGILTLPTHPYVDARDRRNVVDVVRRTVADGGPVDATRDDE